MADGKRRYKSDRKDYKISVKLSEKDMDILKAALKRTGMTASAYIRELIRTGGNIDTSYPEDRAGITLIVTVAFSISSMFYNISTDYPFFMVAFLQIVCFAGIYMKLGDLMSMFSLNAGDSQNMGRRIFRRPYLFMRHRARRMEHRIARAVSAGGISGGVAGAVAGSAVAGKRAERKNTASKENRGNTTSSMGQRAGSKVGDVLF